MVNNWTYFNKVCTESGLYIFWQCWWVMAWASSGDRHDVIVSWCSRGGVQSVALSVVWEQTQAGDMPQWWVLNSFSVNWNLVRVVDDNKKKKLVLLRTRGWEMLSTVVWLPFAYIYINTKGFYFIAVEKWVLLVCIFDVNLRRHTLAVTIYYPIRKRTALRKLSANLSLFV